jgi:uracil-DNA glycosylase
MYDSTMPTPTFTFPFGRPVRPCKPASSEPRPAFILGAYPSALHVEWLPPGGHSRIRAIAVDNEPEPFWNGADQDARIARWKRAVRFDPATMGEIGPAGKLNGSSGAWVDANVLEPLGITRADAWITDALDTYRCSRALAARLEDTYDKFARRAGLPASLLAVHPSEREIVEESLREHRERLLAELEACRPVRIVTLGNAALAVIRGLLPREGGADVKKLSARDGYGTPVILRLAARRVELLPLAHPAAPSAYRKAHDLWRTRTSPGRPRG